MISKTKVKNNTIKKNVTKAAFIQYHLKKNGYTQSQIAKELKISPTAVWFSVNGVKTISKVDDWLERNLGLEVVNG